MNEKLLPRGPKPIEELTPYEVGIDAGRFEVAGAIQGIIKDNNYLGDQTVLSMIKDYLEFLHSHRTGGNIMSSNPEK